jgi:hypothetical protein
MGSCMMCNILTLFVDEVLFVPSISNLMLLISTTLHYLDLFCDQADRGKLKTQSQ